MKSNLLLAVCLLCGVFAQAQISYSVLPLNNQVFPRNLKTGNGTIVVSGNVAKTSGYTSIKIDKYRGTALQTSYSQNITYTSDSSAFSFSIPIKAELTNYFIKVYGVKNGTSTFSTSVDSLLAGDAFIIEGQSNAAAAMNEGSANVNQSTFIRVYGSSGRYIKQWFYADGDVSDVGVNAGNTGQWGLRLARRLMDSEKIPVVVFNGAHGGKPVAYFKKVLKADNNNYARLLRRVTESGFINNIRAIFWYQGESDSNLGEATNSVSVYKRTFDSVYGAWKRDYKGFGKLYIIQTKQSCNGDAGAAAIIQEAHRQLADSIPNTSILSTHGLRHYNGQLWCHYNYDSGYKTIGDYLFLMVNRDLNNLQNVKNVESPQVSSIKQTAANKLTLSFKQSGDDFVWDAGTENDFVIHGVSAKVVSGEVVGSTLVLTLNKNIRVDTLSFYGHMIGGRPTFHNTTGEGIIGFYKMLVNHTTANSLVTKSANDFISAVTIAPNPVQAQLQLQYQLSAAAQVVINITDNTGKQIITNNTGNQTKGAHTQAMNVGALQQGFYTLEVVAGNYHYTAHFIKQ